MPSALWPILRMAACHPQRVAVVDDRRSWRYLDLLGGAFHLARHIEKTTEARHVGILLPTSGAFPMALLATWILGRVAVPVNYLLSERERQYVIDDSGIDTIVTAGPMLDFLGLRPTGVKLLELDKLPFRGFPPLRIPARAKTDDIAVILYTSGTSGRPKGVMLTHGNLVSNVRACVIHARLTKTDGFLGVLPQFHSFGLTALTLIPLMVGARVTYTARFIPQKLVELIRREQPDIVMAIPSMYNALLAVKNAGPEDFRSIRYAISGGEPLPRAVFERFQERFGVRLLEGYGLTETSPVVAWSVPWAWKSGAVGPVIPGVRVRIVDENEQDIPLGHEGEILIQGLNIMAGYYKLPQQTAEVLRPDGYFRTGDWGKLDAEGLLHITGRKKEMLIIAGENVFPREIEEVLNEHPAIKDSAVVAQMDPSRGEIPIAFIELREGASFDETAVRSFCREHLAGFKVPREIRVVESLPRNPTGKVLRRELKL